MPVEVYFILSRARELADKDSSLKERQPFKAALEGDANYFHYGDKDNASLDVAKKHGFTIVNIKSDWKTVFGIGQATVAK